MNSKHPRLAKFFGTTARPFLKWPGGKRSLVAEIIQHFPSKIKRYREPFLGGGAIFFGIADRLKGLAYLSDANEDLINTYDQVKHSLDLVVYLLRDHADLHDDPKYYYHMRDLDVATLKPEERAARFIYLNRTCFNGLYRVNKKGKFNVARGSYKSPSICDEVNLAEVHDLLMKRAILSNQDYTSIVCSPGDVIYCDPPYDGTFTSYTVKGFTGGDSFTTSNQSYLQKTIIKWVESGAKVVLSNSDTQLIRELYGDSSLFTVYEVTAPRLISRSTKTRKPVTELLIVSKEQN